ncbi:MAG: hypothetical protein RLZZ78_1340 [Armatimonadota bacterium]
MWPLYHFNVLLMWISKHKIHNFSPAHAVEHLARHMTPRPIFMARSVPTENDHARQLACHALSRTSLKYLPIL